MVVVLTLPVMLVARLGVLTVVAAVLVMLVVREEGVAARVRLMLS